MHAENYGVLCTIDRVIGLPGSLIVAASALTNVYQVYQALHCEPLRFGRRLSNGDIMRFVLVLHVRPSGDDGDIKTLKWHCYPASQYQHPGSAPQQYSGHTHMRACRRQREQSGKADVARCHAKRWNLVVALLWSPAPTMRQQPTHPTRQSDWHCCVKGIFL